MDAVPHRAHSYNMELRQEGRATERPLVSVVDDDESVRESLPDLLGEFGFAARAFLSAKEFLTSDCVDQTRCLILDIAMPGMSGPKTACQGQAGRSVCFGSRGTTECREVPNPKGGTGVRDTRCENSSVHGRGAVRWQASNPD